MRAGWLGAQPVHVLVCIVHAVHRMACGSVNVRKNRTSKPDIPDDKLDQ